MVYYMIWLGEILFMDFDPIEMRFDELYKIKIRTKEDAIQKMYQCMVSIFSPFGEGYTPASINEIQTHNLIFENIFTLNIKHDIIHIEPKKNTNNYKSKHKQNDMLFMGYGVSGGLHLAFASILIEENVFRTYIINQMTIKDFSFDKERKKICDIIAKNNKITQLHDTFL